MSRLKSELKSTYDICTELVKEHSFCAATSYTDCPHHELLTLLEQAMTKFNESLESEAAD